MMFFFKKFPLNQTLCSHSFTTSGNYFGWTPQELYDEMGQDKLIQIIIFQRGLSHVANGNSPCIVSVYHKAISRAENLPPTHRRTQNIFKPATQKVKAWQQREPRVWLLISMLVGPFSAQPNRRFWAIPTLCWPKCLTLTRASSQIFCVSINNHSFVACDDPND